MSPWRPSSCVNCLKVSFSRSLFTTRANASSFLCFSVMAAKVTLFGEILAPREEHFGRFLLLATCC